MMKPCLLLSLLFFSYSVNAQAPDIEWQNTIGGDAYDELYKVLQTTDGGYILGGSSNSGMSGDKTGPGNGETDYWLAKVDSMGNIEWDKTIGGNSFDELSDVKQTPDGGYILAGSSISSNSGDKSEESIGFSYDYWVVKTDSEGNVEWDNTIGGDLHDWLQSIDIITDDGYILGGYSWSGISGDKSEANLGLEYTYDYWVVKLDIYGEIELQNTIGGSTEDWLYSISATEDGGFILGGKSLSDASADKTEDNMGMEFTTDYWVVKLNSSLEIEYDNTIGGDRADNLISLTQTFGGYILAGYSTSGSGGDKSEDAFGIYLTYDYWIVKINDSLIPEWDNTIWGDSMDYLMSIKETLDGGYIIGGYSSSDSSGDKTENSNGDDDYWVVKLDMLGNIEWDKTYGGNTFDFLRSIIATSDGGFLSGGSSLSEISGDKTESNAGSSDYWIVKLSPPDCTLLPFYADSDEDGFGDSMVQVMACVPPAGYVSDSTDCNDSDFFIHPAMDEICNTIDDNCNSGIDEGLPVAIFYFDADEDNYGDPTLHIETCADTIPTGYVADSTDCNDSDALIHEPLLYFADTDNDFYGDPLLTNYFCLLTAPSGYAENDTDCDDTNPFINPLSNEIENGIDDNCNDTIDEGYVTVLEENIQQFSIYPIPNDGDFIIQTNNYPAYVSVMIYNLLGEKIFEKEFFHQSELHIQIQDQNPGIYQLFLTIGHNIFQYPLEILN